MLDQYIAVKSNEDLTQLYLFLKRYMNDKCQEYNVQYNKTNSYIIYVDKSCFNKASEAFAEYLVRNYVSFFIQELKESINYDISYDEEIELGELLSQYVINCQKPKIINEIKEEIEEFSKTYSEINLDGFVIFAFRKYEQAICDCISDELIMIKAEEEYEKILSLVSEYISVSENYLNILNIDFLKNNSFICYDEFDNDITEMCKTEAAKEFGNEGNNFEDELLSILLTQNPNECIVHLNGFDINDNLFHTLKRLFGDRIIFVT